ncbi:hypothetical protein HLB23_06300 [Nocardia uniformis]|uniref:Uncharacterized protein n=1 Tax=Nocardia uniformis TaxID=53432 RepID=A0A849BSC8_9NOCA|nr:hypothetical protein [Nocardia uniformis]NNH69483.1 hypothetical protein [Nocardia uniformis]
MTTEQHSPHWADIVGRHWPAIGPGDWNALESVARDAATTLNTGDTTQAQQGFDQTVRASGRLQSVKDRMIAQHSDPQAFADALAATADVLRSFSDVTYRTRHQILDIVDRADRNIQAENAAAAEEVAAAEEAAEDSEQDSDSDVAAEREAERARRVAAMISGARADVADVAAAAVNSITPVSLPELAAIAEYLGQPGPVAPNPPLADEDPTVIDGGDYLDPGADVAASTDPGTTSPNPYAAAPFAAFPLQPAGWGGLDSEGAGPTSDGSDTREDTGTHGPGGGRVPGGFTSVPGQFAGGDTGAGGSSVGIRHPMATGPASSTDPAESSDTESEGDSGTAEDDIGAADHNSGSGDENAGTAGNDKSTAGTAGNDTGTASGGTDSPQGQDNELALGKQPGEQFPCDTADSSGVPPVGVMAPVVAPPPPVPATSAPPTTPAPNSTPKIAAGPGATPKPAPGANPLGNTTASGPPQRSDARTDQPIPAHTSDRPNAEDVVGAAMSAAAAPTFIVGDRVDGDLVLAQTLLGGILAAVGPDVLGLDWAVATLRGPGGLSAFVTSNEGRGWLPTGLFLPREVSLPWVWTEADRVGAAWEGVADPARVLVEFGTAWGARSGGHLSALASSTVLGDDLRTPLREVPMAASVPPSDRWDLRTPAPGLTDRLGTVGSPDLLARANRVPTEVFARCTELAWDAHTRVGATTTPCTEASLARETRQHVLTLLRGGDPVPAELWGELRDADDLLVAAMLSRRITAGRIELGGLKIDRESAVLRAIVFERRCDELLLLLADAIATTAAPRQLLRDALYAHAQIAAHPHPPSQPTPADPSTPDPRRTTISDLPQR